MCLLNATGEIQRIRQETFIELKPEGILLLTEKPAIIAERRQQRDGDGITYDFKQIDHFQKEEIDYAVEISQVIEIPLFISKGSQDIDSAIEFISSFIK